MADELLRVGVEWWLGAGSGFMDESSTDAKLLSHIAHGCSGTSTYPYYFTTNPPAIASDLDGFAGLFTTRYGKVMQGAVKSVAPNTMIGLCLYQPPDFVAKALGPYADFLNYRRSRFPVEMTSTKRRRESITDSRSRSYLSTTSKPTMTLRWLSAAQLQAWFTLAVKRLLRTTASPTRCGWLCP